MQSESQVDLAQQYRRFVSWQCRLRKQSMREQGGRPSPGMSAGVYAISGGSEQSRLNFLIQRFEPQQRTEEFRHLVRKTPDPSQWIKAGLRLLSELHYHQQDQFEDRLTALFNLDSELADALLKASACHLKFAESSVQYAFDFDVASLEQEDALFQSTYWHNHLFNPRLPGRVQVLAFSPRL